MVPQRQRRDYSGIAGLARVDVTSSEWCEGSSGLVEHVGDPLTAMEEEDDVGIACSQARR